MIIYQEALNIIRETASRRSLERESVSIDQAIGRVVASDLHSPESLPSFNNSAMDGFVVQSERVSEASPENPVRLRVAGTIMAGNRPPQSSSADEAFEIMTGAPLPHGPQNSVIKVEEVEAVRDSNGTSREVVIRRPVAFEENVREKGEDFESGQLVLRAGTCLWPEHLLALASLGVSRLSVKARPRIALISTGDELVASDTAEIEPGMIRNSTAPYLRSAIPLYGAEVRSYGAVGDAPGEFISLMNRVLADRPDVILTTGAVSMGKHDFIPSALRDMRVRIHYHKVAIRPGKPGLFAEFDDGPVLFGSPGNPISTAVALRFFVWPYLEALMGIASEKPLRAVLSQPDSKAVSKPDGLRSFFKAQVRGSERGIQVQSLKGQPSFMVSPLLEANGWVVFPEQGSSVSPGSSAFVYPLYPSILRGDWVSPAGLGFETSEMGEVLE